MGLKKLFPKIFGPVFGVALLVTPLMAQFDAPQSGRHACAKLDNTTRITAQDIQTPFDTIPDFGAGAQIVSIAPGNWSSGSTWSLGRSPQSGETVQIRHNVVYNVQSNNRIRTVSVESGGALRFSPAQSTKLVVANLVAKANGAIELGTDSQQIPAGIKTEIVIANQALDTGGIDPRQYGTGLLVLNGSIRANGAEKTPFTRLIGDAAAGAATIGLQQAVDGWEVGDTVVIPDTSDWSEDRYWHNYVTRSEERTIAGISGDRKQITLSSPLQYAHPGARDGNGLLTFYPFVANLTRNVQISSEDPNGTRGHAFFTYRASVILRNMEFRDMGRTRTGDLDNTTFDSQGQVSHIGTNQIGRYPLHLHHVYGLPNPANTGFQGEITGCSIIHSRKWPVTIHDSHWFRIRNNVVYDGQGWGFGTEDGNETGNRIEGNFAANIFGPSVWRSQNGQDGSGYWFWGFNHEVVDNVAVVFNGRSQDIVAGAGFSFNWFPGSSANTRLPLSRGADITGGEFRNVDMQHVPIALFKNNESVGGSTGLVVGALGTSGYNVYDEMETTLIQDLKCWHLFEECFFGYPNTNMVFYGMVSRGNPATPRFHPTGRGWDSGDYWNRNAAIYNSDIQGGGVGIIASSNVNGRLHIRDTYLRNITNIVHSSPATPGTRADMPDREVIAENVRFDAWPGYPHEDIYRDYATDGHVNLRTLNRFLVYDFNGQAGDNFQVFMPEQAPQALMAETAYDTQFPDIFVRLASPVSGLTNAQNLQQFGVATAGELATCSSTRSGFPGHFICPISSRPPINPQLTISRIGSGSGTVTSTDGNINCGAACSHVYAPNATVQLSAVADAGSEFLGFRGEGCGQSVTMSAPRICNAVFEIPGAGGGGGGSGTPSVITVLSFTAKANKRNPLKYTFKVKAKGPYKLKRYTWTVETDPVVSRAKSSGKFTYRYRTPGARVVTVVIVDKRGNSVTAQLPIIVLPRTGH